MHRDARPDRRAEMNLPEYMTECVIFADKREVCFPEFAAGCAKPTTVPSCSAIVIGHLLDMTGRSRATCRAEDFAEALDYWKDFALALPTGRSEHAQKPR
jgi:hypothetical protein